MRKIDLTQGKFTLVDDEDFEFLNQWKWQVLKFHGGWYAARTSYAMGRYHKQNIYMHRLIMSPPPDKVVDHIDGNSLNNQRTNLRLVSKSENQQNRKMAKNNTSGYHGVSFSSSTNKWLAQVRIRGVHYHLGVWNTKEEAALARDTCVKERHGFGRLNFPE